MIEQDLFLRAIALTKLSTGRKRKNTTLTQIEKGALIVLGQLVARPLAMMETQLLLTAAAINLRKLLPRARVSFLETTRAFRNVYNFVLYNLFGHSSNSCLWCKLPNSN